MAQTVSLQIDHLKTAATSAISRHVHYRRQHSEADCRGLIGWFRHAVRTRGRPVCPAGAELAYSSGGGPVAPRGII